MPILENLRKGTDSASTRILIGVVAAVFIFWGVGSNRGQKTSIYAEVNGQSITDTEFRRAFSTRARMLGRNLTEEEESQLATQVLQELIDAEALVQEAKRLGVSVSDEEVAREVVKVDAFQKDGKFHEKTYEKALKANGMSRGVYEANLRRSLTLQKLIDLAGLGVAVTDAELEQAYKARETTLGLTYVRLPTAAFLEDIPVADAERDAFVQQNGDKLKARYDELHDRQFDLPKRYQLRTILLRTDLAGMDKDAVRKKAEEIRAQAAGGADFADLARAWSEDLTASNGGSLGMQAVSQIDPVVATAADKAGKGKVSEVVETGRGYQILLVEDLQEAREIPFEEARNELAVAMIREERAPEVVRAYAQKIVDAWKATGEPPRDLTEPKKLPVDTTGDFSLEEPQIPRIGEAPELRAAAMAAPVGQVLPAPFVVKGTTYVVAVTDRSEADMARFAEAKPMLRAQLLAQRQAEVLEAWTADVKARAKIEQHAKL